MEIEKCEVHPDRKLTHRVLGEVDSFGAEYIEMCDECFAEHVREQNTPQQYRCEWCDNTVCEPPKRSRDYDEGSYGRMYVVCRACLDRRNREALEALQERYPEEYWDE